MSADADFYFVGMRRGSSKSDKRVDGYFVIPQFGFTCRACSGSTRLHPLPGGTYLVSNFRIRTDPAMVRDDVGFSVDLSDKWDPALKRTRSLLRIHPDGNKPGTQGCVGLIAKVQTCHDHLKTLFAGGGNRKLRVIIAKTRDDMSLCTSHGCFIFS